MPEVKVLRATPDKSLSRSRCNLAPFGLLIFVFGGKLRQAYLSPRPSCARCSMRGSIELDE